METCLARPNAVTFARPARSAIVNGGAQPDALRHSLLGKLEQDLPDSLPLCGRWNKKLIQHPLSGPHREKPQQTAILVACEVH
jgi:hypothetical protein